LELFAKLFCHQRYEVLFDVTVNTLVLAIYGYVPFYHVLIV